MMNTTVFTDPEVGHFFNEHFINVKFDMEKGEGRELLKRYGMQVFPTFYCWMQQGTRYTGSLADMMPVNLSG